MAAALVPDAAASTSVGVQIAPGSSYQELSRWIMARSLEAGYVVVPSGGDISIQVEEESGGLHLTVGGLSREFIEPGPPELVQLETLQRVIALLDLAANQLKDSAITPAALAHEDHTTDWGRSAALQRYLELREIPAGLSMPSPLEDPRLVELLELLVEREIVLYPESARDRVPFLCFPKSSGRIEVAVAPAGGECTKTTVVALPEFPASEDLERGAELVATWIRSEQRSQREPRSAERRPPLSSKTRTPASRRAPPSPRWLELEPRPEHSVALELGASRRGRPWELTARISGHVSFFRELGLGLSLIATPEQSSEIATLDLGLTLGPSWQTRLPEFLGISTSLLLSPQLGLMLHHYDLAETTTIAADSGLRAGYQLALPLTLDLRPTRSAISFRSSWVFALDEHRREHRSVAPDGQQAIIWQREPWSVHYLLGLGYWL